ncbi:MAG: class I SAM-dependent methyltransferase [Acidobacteria bacterium]|nr:class I SAM-dependent methyltransferase [Acidobacteriota bacterium]
MSLSASGMEQPGQVTFRDPGGQLVARNGRIFRAVSHEGVECARIFLRAAELEPLRRSGNLVRSRQLSDDEAKSEGFSGCALVLEHEAVFFPSYPSEWTPEMLAAAGHLTLDIMEAALRSGASLKDATPYNILFEGAKPVFVDALSLEPRSPGNPIWLALTQFQRTFLYPLAAAATCGIPLTTSIGLNREGPEPEHMTAWAGPVRRWLPPILGLATLPSLLNRAARVQEQSFYRQDHTTSPEKARFILGRAITRLRAKLDRFQQVRPTATRWTDYQGDACHYSSGDLETKDHFVRNALSGLPPASRVLDVGANLGRYSELATQLGHRVVAIDSDTSVADRLFRKAAGTRADILPLVVDLSAPTPATGWDNSETLSFLQRAEGKFDAVLMLAVVHHLLVTHRIPLGQIVRLASRITKDQLVIEFVAANDPQFVRLCRGREALHAGHSVAAWESEWASAFKIRDRLTLPDSGRILYSLNSRNGIN